MLEKIQEVQYRYYAIPLNSFVLPLLGNGWIRSYGSDLKSLHFHNYMEIGYCYDGQGELIFGERAAPYTNNTFTIIPANYLHNTVAKKGTKSSWEYLFVDAEHFLFSAYADNPLFTKGLLARVNYNAWLLEQEKHKEIASLVLDIMDLYRTRHELYLECAKGLLLALLIRIANLAPDTLQKPGVKSESNGFLKDVIRFVNENFQNRIQVSDIAKACHLSETHFRRLFSQSMKISPLSYVNLVRVEAACKMLRSTSSPIQNIAVQCGFDTLTSFNRNFRELMGVTPQQWRRDVVHYEKLVEKQSTMVFNGWL
jgi:AraC-like DNA-binding protein